MKTWREVGRSRGGRRRRGKLCGRLKGEMEKHGGGREGWRLGSGCGREKVGEGSGRRSGRDGRRREVGGRKGRTAGEKVGGSR